MSLHAVLPEPAAPCRRRQEQVSLHEYARPSERPRTRGSRAPAARYSNAVRTCPVSRVPPISRSAASPAAGKPRASSAYERIASPGQGAQLAAWRFAPDHPAQVALEHLHAGPCRDARSAKNLKALCAHDSGRQQTTDQPRPYPASASLSFSPGIGTFRDRRAAAPARERPRTPHASARCREKGSRRRSSAARIAGLLWQPLSHALPHSPEVEIQQRSPYAVTPNCRQQTALTRQISQRRPANASAGPSLPHRGSKSSASLTAAPTPLPEPSGPAWLRRLPRTTTRRCSSTQDTSGPGRRARNAAVAARNSSGV